MSERTLRRVLEVAEGPARRWRGNMALALWDALDAGLLAVTQDSEAENGVVLTDAGRLCLRELQRV